MATETYELRIEGSDYANYRENVLHFSGSGTNPADTLAGAESLVSAFDSTWLNLWLATVPASYSVTRLTARRVFPKPSAQGFISYGFGQKPGTRGSNAVAQQTCPAIFLVPTMGTFSGGKIFWPTIQASDLVSNSYTAGWKTAVDAVLASMIAGHTTSGITWTQVVYSKKHNSASAITGHNYSEVIGFMIKRRAASGYKGPKHKKRHA